MEYYTKNSDLLNKEDIECSNQEIKTTSILEVVQDENNNCKESTSSKIEELQRDNDNFVSTFTVLLMKSNLEQNSGNQNCHRKHSISNVTSSEENNLVLENSYETDAANFQETIHNCESSMEHTVNLSNSNISDLKEDFVVEGIENEIIKSDCENSDQYDCVNISPSSKLSSKASNSDLNHDFDEEDVENGIVDSDSEHSVEYNSFNTFYPYQIIINTSDSDFNDSHYEEENVENEITTSYCEIYIQPNSDDSSPSFEMVNKVNNYYFNDDFDEEDDENKIESSFDLSDDSDIVFLESKMTKRILEDTVCLSSDEEETPEVIVQSIRKKKFSA